MKQIIDHILAPDYFKDFSCIGNRCRHNCCDEQWKITVDKNTYQKYQNLRGHKELTHKFRKYVKRDKKAVNQFDYAVIEQLSNPVSCAFRTNEGLCEIQAKLGEDFLSITCKRYPRNETIFISDDVAERNIEKTCSISCEEMVRLMLEKKDHSILEVDTKHISYTMAISNTLSGTLVLFKKDRSILEYYYDIKAFCIAVLQNDGYIFEDRLVLLSILLQKLETIEKEGQNSDIKTLLNSFHGNLDNHSYDMVLSEIKDTDIASDTGYFLIKQSLWEDQEPSFIIQRINENLLKSGEWSDYAANYKIFMENRWIFIEHIFVNEFFKDMMPFYQDLSISENGIYLTALYLSLKFFITGYLGHKTDMSDEELIDLVAYFGRLILHNDTKIHNLVGFMKNNNMTSPAYLAVLIKG